MMHLLQLLSPFKFYNLKFEQGGENMLFNVNKNTIKKKAHVFDHQYHLTRSWNILWRTMLRPLWGCRGMGRGQRKRGKQ